ncbi:MAG: radical SAM family heme chaperone HemW [Phycisphaerae bacterium]|nr:radical SAM family heme chaperone HemW [Phycisphaerae bacterium]
MPESISIYVHIPYCISKCNYCGFYSVPLAGCDVKPLLKALIKELDSYKLDIPAETIYIGGGSPSCIGTDNLLWLIDNLNARLGKAKEFTVEINPGQLDSIALKQIRQKGVNRISMGAQSFIDQQLIALGRRYNADAIYKAVASAKAAGFDNISLDTIFALPGQNLNQLQYNLQQLISLDINHVSAYSLSYDPGTPMTAALEKGDIIPADEELDLQMYKLAIEMLNNAGLKQYETSNFAKGSYRCEHNLVYWQGGQYLGIGPAAGSFYRMNRTENTADIARYVQAIEADCPAFTQSQQIEPLQYACQIAIVMLRLIDGIDIEKFKQLTDYDPLSLFKDVIDEHVARGLVEVDAHNIKLSQQGQLIADTIMADFILY